MATDESKKSAEAIADSTAAGTSAGAKTEAGGTSDGLALIEAEAKKAIAARSEPDLMTRIADSKAAIKDVALKSVAVNDAYGNSLAAIGTDSKVESFTNYGFDNDTLNFILWLSLYNDSWVFRRAIDKPSQDEIRAGITLEGDEDYREVYKELKYHRSDLIQLLQWGALFGGSVAAVMLDSCRSDADYAAPLTVDKLRKSRVMRLYVTDRWYGCAPSSETVTDMDDIDFGKPAYYDITLADGKTVRFHHSWVLRYEHRTAPKLVKNGMLQGWGYAEGAHILNELARDDKLKASITSLVDKSLIEIIKMTGMRGVFMGAEKDNEAQLHKRLEMVNWGRTFNSLTFLDKEDEYQQNQFQGLAGLADILNTNMWLIAAALEMPGILFGDMKSGFANDESALERYDETINNRCEDFLRPVYNKFIGMLFAKFGIKGKPEYTFNSLLMKKHDAEQMQSLSAFVDLCVKLKDSGIIDAAQFAKAVQQYSLAGTLDFGLTDENIQKLKEREPTEIEGIDLSQISI